MITLSIPHHFIFCKKWVWYCFQSLTIKIGMYLPPAFTKKKEKRKIENSYQKTKYATILAWNKPRIYKRLNRKNQKLRILLFSWKSHIQNFRHQDLWIARNGSPKQCHFPKKWDFCIFHPPPPIRLKNWSHRETPKLKIYVFLALYWVRLRWGGQEA